MLVIHRFRYDFNDFHLTRTIKSKNDEKNKRNDYHHHQLFCHQQACLSIYNIFDDFIFFILNFMVEILNIYIRYANNTWNVYYYFNLFIDNTRCR